MANRFQRFLFNLSTFSPIVTFAVVVWWIQCGNYEIHENEQIYITTKAVIISTLGLISFLYAFYSVLIVKLCRCKLEKVPVCCVAVKPKDSLVIGSIITYLLPFSNLMLSDYNIGISISIGVLALIALIWSNIVWPNPILLICRYHFYEISNINGGEDFSLISKRNSIKDPKIIKKVITIWDYLMIEVKE